MSGLWTVKNVLSAVGYAIRPKPPLAQRCVMGSPVHPRLWCPRRSLGDGLWCRVHLVEGEQT